MTSNVESKYDIYVDIKAFLTGRVFIWKKNPQNELFAQKSTKPNNNNRQIRKQYQKDHRQLQQWHAALWSESNIYSSGGL